MDHPLTEQEWKGVKGRRPHILAVPFPAQGHVRPLMKFSQQIANHGIKVTFVNTEYIHAKVVAAMSEEDEKQRNIELISIPDGLMPDDDRNNGFIINSGLRKTLLRNLTNLMEKLSCDEKISCVIADISIGWILDIIEKMEAVPVAFLTGAAAEMALTLHTGPVLGRGQ
ncbi:UDP-glycosyltransferase 83A1-like [Olea europaea var. sylvestris]|uniref:UDP-glycosyltransferase 83A1-like n=1 Tax=Olea europaea var. sylvestris TaxID=158386 RepID=UPI000C1D529E|nr:UDP-glycosyltransferase 83A1-like [Olea europaea var. sylvestris]